MSDHIKNCSSIDCWCILHVTLHLMVKMLCQVDDLDQLVVDCGIFDFADRIELGMQHLDHYQQQQRQHWQVELVEILKIAVDPRMVGVAVDPIGLVEPLKSKCVSNVTKCLLT